MTMADMVNQPPHYLKGGIETLDYIQAKLSPEAFEGFCVGNVLKYLSRYQDKGGAEDLKKARVYLNRAIAPYETHELPKSGTWYT